MQIYREIIMIIELPLLRRQLPLPQIIKIESILPFYFFNFFDNEEKKIIFGMIQSTMLMMMMMSDRNRTIFLHYFFTPHSIDYIIVVAAATAAAASVKNIFFIHSVFVIQDFTVFPSDDSVIKHSILFSSFPHKTNIFPQYSSM